MKLTDDVKQRKQKHFKQYRTVKQKLANKENLVRFLHRGKPQIWAANEPSGVQSIAKKIYVARRSITETNLAKQGFPKHNFLCKKAAKQPCEPDRIFLLQIELCAHPALPF